MTGLSALLDRGRNLCRTLKINPAMAYTKLARLDELPEGALLEVVEGNNLYALCNVAGDIRALYGTCPHHGGPLGQGALEGSIVSCPWHAWPFDSATGACMFNNDLRIPTYPVRIEAGDILVDLPEEHA
jgi:nitrite reductase/ring-hydroxylating ferredoxin subunit